MSGGGWREGWWWRAGLATTTTPSPPQPNTLMATASPHDTLTKMLIPSQCCWYGAGAAGEKLQLVSIFKKTPRRLDPRRRDSHSIESSLAFLYMFAGEVLLDQLWIPGRRTQANSGVEYSVTKVDMEECRAVGRVSPTGPGSLSPPHPGQLVSPPPRLGRRQHPPGCTSLPS